MNIADRTVVKPTRPVLRWHGGIEGMVILSGYPHAMYDEALPEWKRVTMETHADGARPRTEVLWLNPACVAALDAERDQRSLFEVAE